MRKLGRGKLGQIYARSHPAITAPVRRDWVDFGEETWMLGEAPSVGDLLNALVLAYGSLEPERRRALMGVLVPNLQAWIEEGPTLQGEALTEAICGALRPGSGHAVEKGGHATGGPSVKRLKGPKDQGHRPASRQANGQQVGSKA